jgi:hypothetical protein
MMFFVGVALAAKALHIKTFAAKATPTVQLLKLIGLSGALAVLVFCCLLNSMVMINIARTCLGFFNKGRDQ